MVYDVFTIFLSAFISAILMCCVLVVSAIVSAVDLDIDLSYLYKLFSFLSVGYSFYYLFDNSLARLDYLSFSLPETSFILLSISNLH